MDPPELLAEASVGRDEFDALFGRNTVIVDNEVDGFFHQPDINLERILIAEFEGGGHGFKIEVGAHAAPPSSIKSANRSLICCDLL